MSTLFLSLNRYIGSNWPAVLPQWSGPEVLDRVWVAPLELAIEPDAFKAAAQMFFEDEISLSVPGVDALSLVLGCGGGGTAISVEVDLLPDFALRLPSLALAFRLQSEFLQPVRAEGGCPYGVPMADRHRLSCPLRGLAWKPTWMGISRS
jgi:hypothetical protein